MKRTLRGIAAAALCLGVFAPRSLEATQYSTMSRRHLSKKVWTCNKCKGKFTPNVSARLCDNCVQ